MMLTALGLMSGTSLDGVDVALIETDGRRVKALGPSGYRPYTEMERNLLRQALYEAADLPDRTARPGCLRDAEWAVTSAHAEAVAAFIAQHRISFDDIDIVGFHGQTVLHRPERRLTVQIGDLSHWPRRSISRSCMTSAPPTSMPAGRARPSCRSTTARSPNRWSGRGRSSWSISVASSRSPHRRRHAHRLRHWSRQCVDRRRHSPLEVQPAPPSSRAEPPRKARSTRPGRRARWNCCSSRWRR